ncbi:MAG: SDR family oxidoreductase [Chloroflexota bacterium]
MTGINIIDCRAGLNGKVVFLTGGMGGIGQACIDSFVAHGAQVAFTYADGQESAESAQQLVATTPEQLSAHPLDLRFVRSIETCMEAVMQRWGRIDIVVNNAAVGSATVAAYAKNSAEQDSAMLTINADGTLKVCQTFLRLMRASLMTDSLKIINLSSVGGGVQVFPGFRLSDGMSKAAVAFMTRQLAAELSDTRVDVFAICPGATNTPMFQASTLNKLSADERRAFTNALPKRRLIEPYEIANIITFLASSYSTPMHGAVIDASMGLGVRPRLITEPR